MIVEALEPGQSYADRPDVVCRVFRLKLQELLHDLREGVIFKDSTASPGSASTSCTWWSSTLKSCPGRGN